MTSKLPIPCILHYVNLISFLETNLQSWFRLVPVPLPSSQENGSGVGSHRSGNSSLHRTRRKRRGREASIAATGTGPRKPFFWMKNLFVPRMMHGQVSSQFLNHIPCLLHVSPFWSLSVHFVVHPPPHNHHR